MLGFRTAGNDYYRDKVVKSLILGLLVYFVGKCIFISINIKTGILPDELAHLQLISAYLESSNIVLDPKIFGPTPAGSISQDRFMYHFLIANLAKLFG